MSASPAALASDESRRPEQHNGIDSNDIQDKENKIIDSPVSMKSDHMNEKDMDLEKTINTPSEHDNDQSSKTSHEIEYQYLEFDTDLPHPINDAHADKPDLPPFPDIQKYKNPFEWSTTKKSLIVWISTISTMLTAYTAGSYASGVTQMAAYWHVSRVAVLVGITIFTAGFALGPMFLAPFSEVQGRRPVFVVTGILFVVCQACCAITRAYYGMLLARFWTGVVSSTFSTMVGGVIADIYEARHRNTPMAIYTGGVFVGTGLGPLVSGFIAQHLDWRWIFYVQIMSCGAVMAIVVFFFPETRGNIILSRRAKMLNAYYDSLVTAGYSDAMVFSAPSSTSSLDTTTAPQPEQPKHIRWKVRADEERGSLRTLLTVSLVRPFHLLFTEPVVFFFSCWISFSWAVLYLTFSAVPLVYSTVYGFSLQETGAVFTVIIVSGVLFTLLYVFQDGLAHRRGFLSSGKPENRLVFPCVEAALLPVGLFWFGWTCYASIPWIVSVLGIGCATAGIMAVYLCVFNYLADTYHRYASSAIAAQSFCRNMLGGAFPLFTDQMFNAMGFHAASSLLGGVGLALTLVPWWLLFWGERIRKRSRFANEILKMPEKVEAV